MTQFQPFNAGCSICPIRHRAVCARCDEDELAQLEAIKFYRTYEAGQPIAWRDDNLETVASVVTGIATLSQTLEDGRTQMLGLLLPSDFIGRPGRKTVAYDVTAVSEVTLCCFRRKPFEAICDETPHVGNRLLEMALDELDSAREWMLLLGRKTAREKIASFLMMVVRRTTHNTTTAMPGHSFDLPLTREDIANYLGLTLETVSRQISKLKSEKVIQIQGNRHVTILDPAALLAATGDDA